MSVSDRSPRSAEGTLKKRLLWTAGIGFLVLYSLLCFVLIPAQLALQADVAAGEWAVQLLYYLCTVTELCALILYYAVLIVGFCRFGLARFGAAVWLFLGATAYKYLANTCMDWARAGAVPAAFLWDLIDVLFYVALESVQLLILLLIFKRVLPVGKAAEDCLSRVHFTSLYDRRLPLMRASLCTSVVILVSKLIGTPLSDLAYIIMGGFPKDIETWRQMGMVYLSEALTALLYAALCYLGLVLLLPRLAKGLERSEG